MASAILLIAHGSRRDEANRELVDLAARLRERLPGEQIAIAYLELARPTIPESAAACVKSGATSVRLLPYFLSAGAHVTEDLETFRARFAAEYPGVEFRVCPPLGLHPAILDALVDRLAEGDRASTTNP